MDYSKRAYSFLKLNGVIWESEYAHYSIGLKAFSKITKLKAKILDIGCGAGSLTALWQKKLPNLSFDGIDISNKAIKLAKKHYPNIKFRTVPAEKINHKYDCISICEVIEHVENPNKILKNIYQKLNNKGILYLTTQLEKDKSTLIGWLYQNKNILPKEKIAGHIQTFDRKSIAKLIKQSGFKIVDTYYNCHFVGQIEDLIYSAYLIRKNKEVLSFTDYLQKKGGLVFLLGLSLMRVIAIIRNVETLIFRKKIGLGIQIIAIKK